MDNPTTSNPKHMACVACLGPVAPMKYLAWVGSRGKEYATETGKPVPPINELCTALPSPDFERWLASSRKPSWEHEDGDGEDIRNAMITGNIDLGKVRALELLRGKDDPDAKGIVDTDRNHVDLSDGIQEGRIAIMDAVDHFDWSRGVMFSTYAEYWIRQHVFRHYDNHGRTIRIPVNVLADARHDCDSKAARIVADCHAISIDAPRDGDEGDGFSLKDRLQAPSIGCGSGLDDETLAAAVELALSALPSRDADIIRRRFGIGCDQQTLEQIGQHYGLTKERVRQVEAKTLASLKLSDSLFAVLHDAGGKAA